MKRLWYGLIIVLVAIGVYGLLAWRAEKQREAGLADPAGSASQVDSATSAAAVPPPMPAPGAVDSLIGLVTVPAESLPRFETKESDYEVKAVTVYRQSDGWYLLGLNDGGRAWVHSRGTGAYLPLETLLPGRLNYLTRAWDRRLRQTPDVAADAPLVPLPDASLAEVPANVLEATGSARGLWFKVEVYDKSPCSAELPKVIATGWIRGWSYNGEPTAWFFSRGC